MQFDPVQVAHYETVGWRANYARNWPYLFYLMIRLLQLQFHMSLWQALRAAFYITRASIAWLPIKHDLNAVRSNLRKFYSLARESSTLKFDPVQVTDLELKYWLVHREQRDKPDKAALVQALAQLHAAIFGASIESMIPSAESRAEATATVDLITSRRSQDVEADYRRVEECLRQAYQQILAVVERAKI